MHWPNVDPRYWPILDELDRRGYVSEDKTTFFIDGLGLLSVAEVAEVFVAPGEQSEEE